MNDPEGQSDRFLPELAGLLLSEETVSGLLDLIVNLAVAAVPGVSGASVSIMVRDGEHLETSNASSEAFRTVDEAQYKDRAGPCVEAIRIGQEVSITIPAPAWATFSESAGRSGVRSVWSLPLQVRDQTIGALNLYSSVANEWHAPARAAARSLARQAAVVLANAAAFMSAQLTNQHLQEALDTRDVIGQAKGVLMARESITADEAFDILRRASQRSNRKLRSIANEIVERADRPKDPT